MSAMNAAHDREDLAAAGGRADELGAAVGRVGDALDVAVLLEVRDELGHRLLGHAARARRARRRACPSSSRYWNTLPCAERTSGWPRSASRAISSSFIARNGSRSRIARFSGASRADVRGRRVDLDKVLVYLSRSHGRKTSYLSVATRSPARHEPDDGACWRSRCGFRPAAARRRSTGTTPDEVYRVERGELAIYLEDGDGEAQRVPPGRATWSTSRAAARTRCATSPARRRRLRRVLARARRWSGSCAPRRRSRPAATCSRSPRATGSRSSAATADIAAGFPLGHSDYTTRARHARYRRRSCRRCWTSSRPSSSWRSSRRSTSATSSSRAGGRPSAGTRTSRRPGKQLEHERHLKAINEAADQLEQLAEESRGGKVTRNAVKVSAAAARKRRAEEGARAYAEEQRQRAAAADQAKHDPFGSRVPDHSVVHRYARCLSYPEWGVGSVQRHLLHRRRRRHPAVGARLVQPGHPHGARRLAAVRRLLHARPGRRARRALHDRGQARARRGRLRARRAAARLRARRRAAQHRGAAAADDRVLAGGRLRGRGARGARLDPRSRASAPRRTGRRAHLRGHGLAVAGGRRGRARGRARAARRSAWERLGRLRLRTLRSRGRARGARARARASRRREQGLLDLALVAHLAGDSGAEVSACEQATRARAGLRRPRGRGSRTRSRAPTARASASPPASARSRSPTTPRSATCASRSSARRRASSRASPPRRRRAYSCRRSGSRSRRRAARKRRSGRVGRQLERALVGGGRLRRAGPRAAAGRRGRRAAGGSRRARRRAARRPARARPPGRRPSRPRRRG